MDAVETRFAKTAGGGHVAYQVVGDGPIDVLVTRPPVFPIDLMWDEPTLAHFLNRMSSFCRHIWFDKPLRGQEPASGSEWSRRARRRPPARRPLPSGPSIVSHHQMAARPRWTSPPDNP